MTALFKAVQVTLREWRSVGAVWIGLTVLATLAGPFGTMDALAVFPRAAYWGGVIAGAIALHFSVQYVQQYLPAHWTSKVAGTLAYAMILGGAVFGVNVWLFSPWQVRDIASLLWLVMIILVTSGAIHILVRWLRRDGASDTQSDTGPDATDAATQAFLARLPLQKRGPLIRLEAQDHYLLVVTQNGSELVLMRMADAEAALQDVGLRVHRSHWVVPAAIMQVERQKGRMGLVMADGATIPVSRSNLQALRAAGILTS